jgi:hypothetical protein
MTDKITRYRVAEGRELVLPRGLARAPTGENATAASGSTFDVDEDNPEHAVHQRFLRVRVAQGDLIVETRALPTTTGKSGGDK